MSALLSTLPLNEQIEAIYIGYFGRAADQGGASYWTQAFNTDVAAGESANTALTNIANAFAPQAETLAQYVPVHPHYKPCFYSGESRHFGRPNL